MRHDEPHIVSRNHRRSNPAGVPGVGASTHDQDARFTTNGETLYAIILGAPTNAVSIQSLGTCAKLLARPVSEVAQLGSPGMLKWSQTADALVVEGVPTQPGDFAVVLKITPKP